MSGDPRKSKVPRGELLRFTDSGKAGDFGFGHMSISKSTAVRSNAESALSSREFWKYDRFKPCNLSLSRLSDST